MQVTMSRPDPSFVFVSATVHGLRVTSVQKSIERRKCFSDASVDPTTRARRPFDASVDPTDAPKQVRNRDKPSRQAKAKVAASRSS
jgi:hypothetical protein